MDEATRWWTMDAQNVTTLHPVGLGMLVVCAIAMFALPRRWAVIPLLIMACFVSPAQRIVVMGLDFNFIRCMALAGWCRMMIRGEFVGYRWSVLDGAVIAWGFFSTLIYTIQLAEFSALVYRLGTTYDAVGLYFLFRVLVRDWREVTNVMIAFVIISAPVLAFFIVERLTRVNPFAFFGGVPLVTVMREGRMRCQGAFAHPILAGCFWASLVPMFGALLWQGASKKVFAFVGVFNAMGIIFLCASSTPVAALFFGGLAWLAFPLRGHLRWFRWGALGLVISLHLVMHKPVWHLLARVDLVGGSTGWHRFRVVDAAIRYWDEWVAFGLTSTSHWGVVDITNEYVLHGLRGGLVTMLALIAILTLGFSRVGRVLRAEENNTPRLMMAWALGIGLFIHTVSFISVSYFGQIQMVWYLQLAMIASVASITKQRVEIREHKRAVVIAQRKRERKAQRSPVVESLALAHDAAHNRHSSGGRDGA